MRTFVPGQRWISDTETERGLGTILSQDARTVTILYPSSGETRIYRIQNCPLTRIRFEQGDLIESLDGIQMVVDEVEDVVGVLSYKGIRKDNDESFVLSESDLSCKIELNKPWDCLVTGKLGSLYNFSLRYETLQKYQQLQQSPYLGFASSRINLIPHQLYIANEVASRFAPRVLLADEVGLGKTIEAGLIINQKLLSGQAARILILVPETLVNQWFVEMLRRFNIHFSIFDRTRCQEESASNPFEAEQLIISNLEFICSDSHYQSVLRNTDWDLLVVDEAHHIASSSADLLEDNAPYNLVKHLSEKTEGIILLSATPEQTGLESHFARLQLLDPERFYDFNQFIAEMEQYKPIADAVAELIGSGGKLSTQLQQAIEPFLQTDEKQLLVSCLNEENETSGLTPQKRRFIEQLVDRHSISRVMFRNTRQHIDGFPGRGAQGYPLQWPELYDIVLEQSEKDWNHNAHVDHANALRERLSHHLYPELVYQRVLQNEDADLWWQIDPRIDWLIHLIKLLKKAKILIICAHAETAMDVENALRIRLGTQIALFHQKLSIIDRDRAAAWFADPYGTNAMVCSEIGSEGRNFQFSHHLVLFDLPLHPDLLEQRIGRLDRIGQTERVRLHVPYFENKPQHRFFRWLDQGLNIFSAPCNAASLVYSELSVSLFENLLKTSKCFDTFLSDTQAFVAEQNLYLDEGRNRLFEIMSEGQEIGRRIASEIVQQENPLSDQKYLELLLQSFGVDSEDHSEHAIIIRPGNHMTVDAYPGLPSDGMIACFDRTTALSREDMQFVTVGHPVVREGMEMLLTSEIGNTAVGLLLPKDVKKDNAQISGMILEAIFVVEVAADPKLQLHRFLPMTSIRVLIDPTLKNLAAKAPFDKIHKQLTKVPGQIAKKLVKVKQEEIKKMVQQAEFFACEQARQITLKAGEDLVAYIASVIQRLAALKQVNANVRDEELLFLKKQASEGQDRIHNAVLRLDGLKLIFTAQ